MSKPRSGHGGWLGHLPSSIACRGGAVSHQHLYRHRRNRGEHPRPGDVDGLYFFAGEHHEASRSSCLRELPPMSWLIDSSSRRSSKVRGARRYATASSAPHPRHLSPSPIADGRRRSPYQIDKAMRDFDSLMGPCRKPTSRAATSAGRRAAQKVTAIRAHVTSTSPDACASSGWFGCRPARLSLPQGARTGIPTRRRRDHHKNGRVASRRARSPTRKSLPLSGGMINEGRSHERIGLRLTWTSRCCMATFLRYRGGPITRRHGGSYNGRRPAGNSQRKIRSETSALLVDLVDRGETFDSLNRPGMAVMRRRHRLTARTPHQGATRRIQHHAGPTLAALAVRAAVDRAASILLSSRMIRLRLPRRRNRSHVCGKPSRAGC